MLVSGIDWIPTNIDPYVRSPAEGGAELERLKAAVVRFSPDVVIAACPRRNWLDLAVAAAVPRARHVAFASNEDDPYFGVQLRLLLGPKAVLNFKETAPPGSGEQDWERGYGLAEYLLGQPLPHSPPALSVEAALFARADEILKAYGLKPGRFVACAAAGFAHVQIKTWPSDRFAATAGWLHQTKGRRTLLVGHRGERAYLETLRSQSAGSAEVWLGGEGELPLLAALLARSELYFGNDTGAMHLAAALGRPVVAIFGGGTWPRFQPACTRAISLVNPLPCFGCDWDCPFGDAPCIQAVTVSDAQKALSEVLEGLTGPGNEIRRLHSVPYAVAAIMGKTAALARERTAAHLAREHKLVETAYLAREKDAEIDMLKAAANEKDAEIGSLKAAANEKDAEIGSLKAAANEKDAEIGSLKAASNEKDAEIDSLKAAANQKDAEIVSIKATADERDASLKMKEAEIAGLTRACDERLQLIIRLDAQLRDPSRNNPGGQP